MDVSAAEIVFGLVLTACAVAAANGARWISRRSDEQIERTRTALRSRHAVPDQPTRRVPVPGVAADPDSSGRHRVPEELMRAVTYTLSPDRVARAKVPSPRPQSASEPGADRRG